MGRFKMDENLKKDSFVGIDLVSLDKIFESTPSCLKVISGEGLLLHMNPRGLDLIEAEDMASVYRADVYSLVEEAHRNKFIAFNKRICAGKTESMIFEIVGLKGSRRWMESYAAPYTLSNGKVAHIAITNDITARVESENEILHQKQALASSSRLASLGLFVGGVAHEINNPLAIILGKLALLEMSIEKGDIEKPYLEKGLREVIQTTERISEIINSLRMFSRDPETDILDQYSISDIVNETLSLCSENFRLNNIDINCHIDAAIKLSCHKVQLSQVLMNL